MLKVLSLTTLGLLLAHHAANGSAAPVRMTDAYIPPNGRGFAATTAAVIQPTHNTRFTVLTDRLIRMEWRDDIHTPFEDRPTLAVVHRALSIIPVFTQTISATVLTITTASVVLTYRIGARDSAGMGGAAFSHDSLSVAPRDGISFETWHFGESGKSDHVRNLKGTVFGLDMQTVLDLDCTKIHPLAHATSWGRAGKDRGIHQNDIMCEWGLVSKSGWSIVDDAANMVIDPSTDWWVGSPGTSNTNAIDQYLFAHGNDFTAALGDYALIGGRAPLPPRFTLGTMWDRWYDIDAANTETIVQDYALRTMPIDTFVFDQAFHKKDGGDYKSFDTEMFPDPKMTMAKLHANGVGVAMNMHDCGGIRGDEPLYDVAAKLLGYSPAEIAEKKYLFGEKSGVNGYCRSQLFANAIDDVLLGDMEADGVDAWWNDWACDGPETGRNGDHHQACEGGKMSPTMWYNRHRYTSKRRRRLARVEAEVKTAGGSSADLGAALDKAAQGGLDEDRGFVLARFGGLGSHRYPLGFSGDVEVVSWTSLQFSIYMTATSSNAAFGVWSHDILGGLINHMMDPRVNNHAGARLQQNDANVAKTSRPLKQRHAFAANYAAYELGTRWLQWGAFSPILRTHDRGASAGGCANEHWPTQPGDCAQLRPWNVPPIFFEANRIAMRMRAELIPYIYTAYRTLFDTGVPLLRPLYYASPNAPAAYAKQMEATPDIFSGEVSAQAKLANSANQIANQVGQKHLRRRRRMESEADLDLMVSEAVQELEVEEKLMGVEPDERLKGALPELNKAQSEFQFMFGPDLLVAPVVSPADQWNETMGHVKIWFPPGTWIERHSGAIFVGALKTGTLLKELRYHLNEVPVFARAGAMIATIPLFDGSHASAARGDSGGSTVGTAQREFDHLVFTVHLDSSSNEVQHAATSVYEDDGRTTAYMHDESIDGGHTHSAKTTATYTFDSKGTLSFTLGTVGTYPTLPKRRTITLRIRNAVPSEKVTMRIIGGSTADVPLCVARNGHGCVHVSCSLPLSASLSLSPSLTQLSCLLFVSPTSRLQLWRTRFHWFDRLPPRLCALRW